MGVIEQNPYRQRAERNPVIARYCGDCGTPYILYYRPDKSLLMVPHYLGVCGGCRTEHTQIG